MPTLTIPRAAPITGLQGADTVAPRSDYATGSPSQRSDQLNLQEAQAKVGAAGELVDLGVSRAELGAKLLEPFDKLRQSKEFMDAIGIVNRTKIEARAKVEAIPKSGKPYEQWLAEASNAIDPLFRDAAKAAEGISAAAGQRVAGELQQEALDLKSGIQSKAADRGIEEQRATYRQLKEISTQDYFATTDDLKRATIKDTMISTLGRLGLTGVLAPAAADKEAIDWLKEIAHNEVIEYGVTNGIESTPAYAATKRFLSLDDQRKAVNAAGDALSINMKQKHDAEVLATKQAHAEQDRFAVDLYAKATDRNLSNEELLAIKAQARQLGVSSREGTKGTVNYLTREQAEQIINKVDQTITAKLQPQEYHDPRRESTVAAALYLNPTSISIAEINSETQINSQGREKLTALRHTLVKEGSFAKTESFKQFMKDINAVVPLEQRNFFFLGNKQAIGQFIEEAQSKFLFYMLGLAAPNEGVMDEKSVQAAGASMVANIIKGLEELKMSAAYAPTTSTGKP